MVLEGGWGLEGKRRVEEIQWEGERPILPLAGLREGKLGPSRKFPAHCRGYGPKLGEMSWRPWWANKLWMHKAAC